MSVRDEEPITLTIATKVFPTRPALCTVMRWGKVGVRKFGDPPVVLEILTIGGVNFTSAEAVERFILACNERRKDKIERRNVQSHGEANRELIADGL